MPKAKHEKQIQANAQIAVTPEDCDVFENMTGTGWGPTAPAAKAAAAAEAKAVFDALKIRCPDSDCPFPKKKSSVGKPKRNSISFNVFAFP